MRSAVARRPPTLASAIASDGTVKALAASAWDVSRGQSSLQVDYMRIVYGHYQRAIRLHIRSFDHGSRVLGTREPGIQYV